jgi:enoyl-[acyl-carrier protein] reductase II
MDSPTATIGKTILGGAEVAMPKLSVLLPTSETEGDFEEMSLTMEASAGLVHEVKPAGVIMGEMLAEAAQRTPQSREPGIVSQASL